MVSKANKHADIRDRITALVRTAINDESAIFDVTVPDRKEFGHYTTNVAMRLAKLQKKNPIILAGEIAVEMHKQMPSGFIEKVETVPPGFINIWVKAEALQDALKAALKAKEQYGASKIGKGKTVIVEHSSSNIAKAMHVGHFRNTAIGDMLANAYDALGYKVIRWNYLGDWGTQFGKLIAAYKMWGDKKVVEEQPIKALLDLYVRYSKAAKEDPALEESARTEFKKLEEGNRENRKLWEWFKKVSLEEYGAVYKRLGVKFDTQIGESFFGDTPTSLKALKALAAELVDLGIAVRSEGALIVPLEAQNLPPGMIEKSDGASTYLMRDIALLQYTLKKYKPAKILHVIGNEQSLAMDHVLAIGKALQWLDTTEFVHVKYGLVLGETGRKFSTREGEVVFAEEVMQKAVDLALKTVEAKRSDLKEKEKRDIAEKVGIGALKYANLREGRTSDIQFNWESMLDFSGDSSPYIQYTYARLRSIERKASLKRKISSRILVGDIKYLQSEQEISLMHKISQFPHVIELAAHSYAPNLLTLYLYELANGVNRFYETTPILNDPNPNHRNAHLLLVLAVAQVLKNGMKIAGIEVPEKI